MNAQELLQEISDYCRHTGLAESTFGRRAVNDGKLASRLRHGGRITTETLDRIRSFMANNQNPGLRPTVIQRPLERTAESPAPQTLPPRSATSASSTTGRSTCCSSTPAARSGWSPTASARARQHPSRARRRCACSTPASATAPCCCARDARDARPLPDDAVLYRRQGDQPRGHPADPREDAGPLLRAPGDRRRAHQHRSTDAPWLRVKSLSAPRRAWSGARCRSPAILGAPVRAADHDLSPSSARTGRPASAQDRQPGLRAPGGAGDLPRRTTNSCSIRSSRASAAAEANYDLVIASQPYRARASLEFKAKRVIAPLARALGPGRAPDRHPFARQRSRHGDHPAHLAGRQSVHPDRHQIMKAVKQELGPAGRDLNFNAYADNRSLFRYDMHTLPSEVSRNPRSAPRRCSRPGTRRSTSRRSRTTASRKWQPTGAISTPPATSCRSTAGCGSTTNPS
jgi:hypothetical protein